MLNFLVRQRSESEITIPDCWLGGISSDSLRKFLIKEVRAIDLKVELLVDLKSACGNDDIYSKIAVRLEEGESQPKNIIQRKKRQMLGDYSLLKPVNEWIADGIEVLMSLIRFESLQRKTLDHKVAEQRVVDLMDSLGELLELVIKQLNQISKIKCPKSELRLQLDQLSDIKLKINYDSMIFKDKVGFLKELEPIIFNLTSDHKNNFFIVLNCFLNESRLHLRKFIDDTFPNAAWQQSILGELKKEQVYLAQEIYSVLISYFDSIEIDLLQGIENVMANQLDAKLIRVDQGDTMNEETMLIVDYEVVSMKSGRVVKIRRPGLFVQGKVVSQALVVLSR
jgi:hypothetical protein